MTNWRAEYDAAIADPRKARILNAAAHWVKAKLWVRDAVAAGAGPLPWRSFREWAGRYWPGGWDRWQQEPDKGKIHLVPGHHLLTLALIGAGVHERHVLDHGLVQWAEIGDDRRMLVAFSEAWGDIDFGDRGLVYLPAPWEPSLRLWVPKGWSEYDWSHNVPMPQQTRVPITFAETPNGDARANFGWRIGGPTREWLWRARPDLRAWILKVPLPYPLFAQFDPRVHAFESRAQWEAWRDLQLSRLPRGEAVPVPGYVPPNQPTEPEPPEPEPEEPAPELRELLDTMTGLLVDLHEMVSEIHHLYVTKH